MPTGNHSPLLDPTTALEFLKENVKIQWAGTQQEKANETKSQIDPYTLYLDVLYTMAEKWG